MKTSTETLANFKVYEDGKLVKTDYAAKKAAVIGSTVMDGLSAYGEQVKTATGHLFTNIGHSLMAGAFDAFHGTDTRDQLHKQWEDAQYTEFVGRIGLS